MADLLMIQQLFPSPFFSGYFLTGISQSSVNRTYTKFEEDTG